MRDLPQASFGIVSVLSYANLVEGALEISKWSFGRLMALVGLLFGLLLRGLFLRRSGRERDTLAKGDIRT